MGERWSLLRQRNVLLRHGGSIKQMIITSRRTPEINTDFKIKDQSVSTVHGETVNE